MWAMPRMHAERNLCAGATCARIVMRPGHDLTGVTAPTFDRDDEARLAAAVDQEPRSTANVCPLPDDSSARIRRGGARRPCDEV